MRALAVLLLVFASLYGCADRRSSPPREAPGRVEYPVGSAAALETGMPSFGRHDGVLLLSWLERTGESVWTLRAAEIGADGRPGAVATVEERTDFFVNWADFPSVTPFGEHPGRWVAHWLQRGDQGGYDYGIRVVTTEDAGASWSDPWTPHTDGTPTEHGFVSVLPSSNGFGLLWLDGRTFASGENRMRLYSRSVQAGAAGPERSVDGLVCDCCQTDAAPTNVGALAVYRDRTEDEVRDIHAARWLGEEGRWETLGPVHDDGWVIAGCPVNGPAVAVHEGRAAVAWFTAARDEPAVKVAFGNAASGDFGEPVRLDRGAPVGRVDVQFDPDGRAWVLWMEGPSADGVAELLLAEVGEDGSIVSTRTVSELDAARGSGFPRLAFLPDGDALVAWTHVADGTRRLRLLRLPVTP